TLTAQPGDMVKITLINEDGMLHDLVIDEFDVRTRQFAEKGEQETVTFQVNQTGDFIYYCSVPGHQAAGMYGTLRVGGGAGAAAEGATIIRQPSDVPPAVGDRAPQTVPVELIAEEVV